MDHFIHFVWPEARIDCPAIEVQIRINWIADVRSITTLYQFQSFVTESDLSNFLSLAKSSSYTLPACSNQQLNAFTCTVYNKKVMGITFLSGYQACIESYEQGRPTRY